MLRSGMSQKMRSTTRKLIANGHKKLCSSNRNNQPNNANIVATTMMIGVILATNRPISRFFSFGLFFPSIILCFPLLQGVKKACRLSETRPACSISDCWHKTFQVTENRDTRRPFVSITWTIQFCAVLGITHLQTVCKCPAEKIFAKTEPCNVSFAARLERMRRRAVARRRIRIKHMQKRRRFSIICAAGQLSRGACALHSNQSKNSS